MDVGETRSNLSSTVHFVTGLIVVTLGYSGVLLAIRAALM